MVVSKALKPSPKKLNFYCFKIRFVKTNIPCLSVIIGCLLDQLTVKQYCVESLALTIPEILYCALTLNAIIKIKTVVKIILLFIYNTKQRQ